MAEKPPVYVFNRAVKTIKWFHPRVTSKKAETILEQRGQVGSFIVHPSASIQGAYSISVKRETDVTHVRINNGGDFYDLYGGETFATLPELVQYYLDPDHPLVESNGTVISLLHPLNDEEPASERWYHGKVSGSDASNLLNTRGSIGSFLVRESISKPGEYAISVLTEQKVVHVLIRFQCTNTDAMYDVGHGPQFKTLPELVEHYIKNPITETCGRVLDLTQPLNATRITASGLNSRVTDLDDSSAHKGEGFFMEFEELQQQDAVNAQSELYSRSEGQKAENRPKNRFKNILPYDHSRVILRDGDPSSTSSQYINANIVQIKDKEIIYVNGKTYIATQGCLNHTIPDFWRMMYQENSQIIAMTTKTVEGGKNKCAQYWPDAAKPELVKEVHNGKIVVKWLSEQITEDYILREMTLSKVPKNKSHDKNTRTVYHYHFTAWPDKQVPRDPSKLIKFIEAINQKYTELDHQGAITVHCSAGIGRTGTTIILDHMLDLIQQYGVDSEIDIAKAIQIARQQRSGLVQTDAQYRFIYLAIKYYLEEQKTLTQGSKVSRHTAPPAPRQEDVYENVHPAPRRATQK